MKQMAAESFDISKINISRQHTRIYKEYGEFLVGHKMKGGGKYKVESFMPKDIKLWDTFWINNYYFNKKEVKIEQRNTIQRILEIFENKSIDCYLKVMRRILREKPDVINIYTISVFADEVKCKKPSRKKCKLKTGEEIAEILIKPFTIS